MNRKLTTKEKELTKNNMERQKQLIKELKEQLELNELSRNFLLIKRQYEDRIRPMTRKNQDKEIELEKERLESEILQSEFAIKNGEKQLKEGVDVKENKAVN